jgi:hypothetical protein
MIKKQPYFYFLSKCLLLYIAFMLSCKSKKHVQQTAIQTQVEDTIGKCRLQFKTAKSLSKHIKESELNITGLR